MIRRGGGPHTRLARRHHQAVYLTLAVFLLFGGTASAQTYQCAQKDCGYGHCIVVTETGDRYPWPMGLMELFTPACDVQELILAAREWDVAFTLFAERFMATTDLSEIRRLAWNNDYEERFRNATKACR